MHHGRSRSKALDNINVVMLKRNRQESTYEWSKKTQKQKRMSGVTGDRNMVPPRLQPFRWHPSLTCKFLGKLTQLCAHITLHAHMLPISFTPRNKTRKSCKQLLDETRVMIMCMTNCENKSRPHGNRYSRQGPQSSLKGRTSQILDVADENVCCERERSH